MRQRLGRRQEGFTLIEMLITMVVISIMAAIAIPVYLGQRQRAKEAGVKVGLHTIQVAIVTYAADHNDAYPSAEEVNPAGLGELASASDSADAAILADKAPAALAAAKKTADATAETAAAAELVAPTVESYSTSWPKNPWTSAPMAQSENAGDFTYAIDSDSFVLTGMGANGPIITLP
jgi:type IV pilus assembly protein PilA